jgi:hypothetical protein
MPPARRPFATVPEAIVRHLLLIGSLLLAGCQTTHEQLLAEGYPPAFADGFQDGCSSGRQAAGAISGQFRKDVPRFLADATYATGWSDGFNQCHAQRVSEQRQDTLDLIGSDRDREWEQHKTQAMGKALRRD